MCFISAAVRPSNLFRSVQFLPYEKGSGDRDVPLEAKNDRLIHLLIKGKTEASSKDTRGQHRTAGVRRNVIFVLIIYAPVPVFFIFCSFFFGSSVTDFVLLFYSISSSKFSLGRVFLCPAGFSLGRLSRPAWCGWMRRGGVLLDCLQSKEVFFLIVLLFLVFSALGTVCVLRPRRRRWAIAQIFFRCAIFLSCFVFFSFCLVSVGEARRERRRKTIFREANKRKEAKIKKKNTKISTRPKKKETAQKQKQQQNKKNSSLPGAWLLQRLLVMLYKTNGRNWYRDKMIIGCRMLRWRLRNRLPVRSDFRVSLAFIGFTAAICGFLRRGFLEFHLVVDKNDKFPVGKTQ